MSKKTAADIHQTACLNKCNRIVSNFIASPSFGCICDTDAQSSRSMDRSGLAIKPFFLLAATAAFSELSTDLTSILSPTPNRPFISHLSP